MRHEFPLYLFLIAFALYTIVLFLSPGLLQGEPVTAPFFPFDKKAPWPVVAYGMVGASISGVTFVSVPVTYLRRTSIICLWY